MSEAPEGIASIAGRGLSDPASLSPEEIQSLCGWVLPNIDTPPAPTMSEEVRAELTARRAEFKRKADKRRDQAGFSANVAELEAWMAEIDAELGQ